MLAPFNNCNCRVTIMSEVPQAAETPQLPGSVQIILTSVPRQEAYEELFEQAKAQLIAAGNNESGADSAARLQLGKFKGPYFKQCVAGVQIDTGFVTVHLLDGQTYTYPMHGVARIKTFVEV